MTYIPTSADIPQATAPVNSTYTPTLSDIPNTNNTSTGALGMAFSASDSFLKGANEAAVNIGSLAKNILKGGAHLVYGKLMNDPETEQNVKEGLDLIGNLGSKLTDKVEDYLSPKTPFEQQALKEHTTAGALGQTLGYVGGTLTGGNALAKPISSVTTPLSKVAPIISKSPITAGIVDSATQNAIIGAAADPNNPVSGAIAGGTVGALVHGITGAIGYKINKAGNIINREIENAKIAGIDPGDHTSIYNIQAALKNDGVKLRAVDIKDAVQKQASNLIDSIRPDTYNPSDSPINVVSKAASENFPAQVARSKILYAPINNSTEIVEAPNYTNALASIPAKTLQKISMPDSLATAEKPGEVGTLNTLLGQRIKLDNTLAQTKSLMKSGEITATEAQPIFEARAALNQDIHQGAAKLGLADQLQTAEDHYNNTIRPFQVYNKNLMQLKQMSSDQIQGKVWKLLNRQLQARFPDPNAIKQVAQTLGPEGRELVGWAKIENDFRVSTVNGVFQPNTFGTRISKSANSGLNDLIMTEEQKQVVSGLQNLGKAAAQILSRGEPVEAGKITQVIQHLMYSRPGIQVLKVLGSPSASMVNTRSFLRKVLEGTLAISAGASGK